MSNHAFFFFLVEETLFIMGNDSLSRVEAVSLSGAVVACPTTLPDQPYAAGQYRTPTIDGNPVLCGGYDG